VEQASAEKLSAASQSKASLWGAFHHRVADKGPIFTEHLRVLFRSPWMKRQDKRSQHTCTNMPTTLQHRSDNSSTNTPKHQHADNFTTTAASCRAAPQKPRNEGPPSLEGLAFASIALHFSGSCWSGWPSRETRCDDRRQ